MRYATSLCFSALALMATAAPLLAQVEQFDDAQQRSRAWLPWVVAIVLAGLLLTVNFLSSRREHRD